MLFLRGFILNPTERKQALLKNCTKDFQCSPPFEWSACFYVSVIGNFERFEYFNFETNFLISEKTFLVESTKIENPAFSTKLPCQKPMFRQRELGVQNGPISNNWACPVTTFFFWKLCFSLRTSELSWFDVPTTQMPIFTLFESVGVLFEGAFFLGVSVNFR